MIDRVKRSPAGDRRTKTTLRLRPELLEDLRVTAHREGRTASNLIERLLITGLKRVKNAAKPGAAETPSVFE